MDFLRVAFSAINKTDCFIDTIIFKGVTLFYVFTTCLCIVSFHVHCASQLMPLRVCM